MFGMTCALWQNKKEASMCIHDPSGESENYQKCLKSIQKWVSWILMSMQMTCIQFCLIGCCSTMFKEHNNTNFMSPA